MQDLTQSTAPSLQVWTRGLFHLTCTPATESEAQALQAQGWQLVWTEAPNAFHGFMFALVVHFAPLPYA